VQRSGYSTYAKEPDIPEQCRECNPVVLQARVVARVLTETGEVHEALFSDGATRLTVNSSCVGKEAGKCALKTVCIARRGEAIMARQEISAAELGA